MNEAELLPVLKKALKDLRYGTIQLVVHDGKLARVERLERIHLPSRKEHEDEPTGPSGG